MASLFRTGFNGLTKFHDVPVYPKIVFKNIALFRRDDA
jgi:hypothetical protein